MKSTGDRIEFLLLCVTGALLSGTFYAYFGLQKEKNLQFEAPLVDIAVPTDAAAVAEGERLAKLRGCVKCHGDNLGGKLYFASSAKGIIVVAPNLTQTIREYSSAEFVRTVRHGIRPDNTSVEIAMPSFAFYNLSDADMGRIMAYIKNVPEQEGLEGGFHYMPFFWWRHMLTDTAAPTAALIDHAAKRPPGEPL